MNDIQEEALSPLTVVWVSHAVPQHGTELPLRFWLRETIVAVPGEGLPQVNWELPWQLNKGLSDLLLTWTYTEKRHLHVKPAHFLEGFPLFLCYDRENRDAWDMKKSSPSWSKWFGTEVTGTHLGQANSVGTNHLSRLYHATSCPFIFKVAINYTFLVTFQRNYFIGFLLLGKRFLRQMCKLVSRHTHRDHIGAHDLPYRKELH